jgi:hypothetical protein
VSERCSTWAGEYGGGCENKHSNLFCLFLNDEEKFCNIDNGFDVIFFSVLDSGSNEAKLLALGKFYLS